MNFCQAHWDTLRAAIDERGLTPLIAQDGQAAVDNMVAQLEQRDDVSNYDPLMAAMWAIDANALKLAGLALMMVREGSADPPCPLCFLNIEHKRACNDPDCQFTYDDWINKAADEELEHVNQLKAGG